MAVRGREWTVRVVQFRPFPLNNDFLTGMWVEQLRYMGHCKLLAEFDDPDRMVIEFYAPDPHSAQQTKVWAEQNAARMRSFGVNAVAAPKWGISHEDKIGYLENLGKKDVH